MALPIALWVVGLILTLAGFGYVGVVLGIVGLVIGLRRWQARKGQKREGEGGR